MDLELFTPQQSQFLYPIEINEQSFEDSQSFIKNKTLEQNSLGATQAKTQQMVYQQKDLNYKNFPKLIGNNFLKWVNKQVAEEKIGQIPQGIENLMKSRGKCKQPNFTIKDLQQLCRDQASQKLFQEFMQYQLFLDLFHSNKIADPYSYIPGISNYFSAAEEPDKMKSNYLTRNQFTQASKQN
ncbi:unnamed protein product (macronuclear) [Paramecium tetraurelia]|uniref:RGS domain-containing protein n=1 Tax=Paramecium tetraurelia TaxID=5888 RepID=A0BX78_PARTE|nr:uncharacterized protein GSPATT00032998001 [Paramecium tetraurelia]CAK63145.1 unnamed protein product [Paramecium tetraurelia]|eukprot:XP_001430543.1 hypothetical protein (macronuclear) [Paramecium tetraurelia strain d4-2]